MARVNFAPVPPPLPRQGEPEYHGHIKTMIRNMLVWRNGQPRRANGAVLDELIALEREIAWNEALDHVWKLSDPANTVVQTRSRKEVLVEDDIAQAKAENPYSVRI